MDVELTELEKLEVTRVDAVGRPANGFPVLLMKGIAEPEPEPEPVAKAGARDCPKCGKGHDADHKGNTCDGCGADLPAADDAEKSALDIIVKAVTDGVVDQAPDIDLGHQIMGLLAQAIIGEAQEIGAGSYGETCDVDLLNCAAAMIGRWTGREAAPGSGDDDDSDAMMLMQSAAKALGVDLPAVAKAGLPATDINDGDTSKSQIAPEVTTVDTVTQETGGLTKAVEEAIAKATQPLQERIKSLDAELAKVKATPVPGGPVLSRNVQVKQPGAAVNEDYAAKAAYFRDQASLWDSQDRQTADGYRLKAREAEAKAVTPTS
jgi:hypothetical protein